MYGYSLWSAERQSGRVKFIPYTQEQRGSVVGNIDRMMKMWVSFESKQHHYNGNANPYPDLDEFRKTYASMTDEQFNFNLTKIFNKMRDKTHFISQSRPIWLLQRIHWCVLQLCRRFTRFVSTTKSASDWGDRCSRDSKLDWKVAFKHSAGDELLTINGVSFDDWYEQNKFILGFGANDSGGHSRAFRYLSGIEGSSNILPEADGITLQLKRVGISQAVYTVTVPYVALSNDECWSLSSNLYKELTGIALPEMPTPRSFRYKRSAVGNGVSLPGNNTLQKGDTDIHKRSYWESVDFEDTKIDGLAWTIWKSGRRNMGVIKIESFASLLTDTGKETNFIFLIEIIRGLLVDQLKDTDAILFDVRGNPGGLIPSADGIIQLLKPDATASQFRYLKNEVTKDLFYKGVASKVHGPRRGVRHHTAVVTLVSGSAYDSSVSNTFGQAYFNPVGFIPMACAIPLVRPSQPITVFSEYLSDVAKKQADKNVYFEYEPYSQSVFNDSMDVTVVASGVDEIIVVSQGKQLGEWRGELSTSRQDCKITVKTPTGLRDHMITFIGKKQGTQVFKTHREFTRVPTLDNRVNMMTTNSYTVSGLSPSVGVYSFGSTPEQEGWNFNNGKWILGDGVSDYSGYMYSTVRVWLTAPVGSTISVSIDAIVDTYESGGFFSLNMMDDSGKVVHMLSSRVMMSQLRTINHWTKPGYKETHSFEVTTEHFSVNLDFVAYSMETPFSVKINSVVLTKD
ncbi:hypothetical protein BASA81_017107 [Batrachochytrium salamandrivorans]|nr:hypothetical protein BASA81_017107 [Batrachochytrium salamandrivorans]